MSISHYNIKVIIRHFETWIRHYGIRNFLDQTFWDQTFWEHPKDCIPIVDDHHVDSTTATATDKSQVAVHVVQY